MKSQVIKFDLLYKVLADYFLGQEVIKSGFYIITGGYLGTFYLCGHIFFILADAITKVPIEHVIQITTIGNSCFHTNVCDSQIGV